MTSVLLIIPGLITWQARGLSEKRKSNKPLKIDNNIRLSFNDFEESLKESEVNLLLNYFNQPEIIEKVKTNKQLLNRFAYQNLILKNIAKKNKITVSNKEVVDFISNHPLFSRKGGFDNKLYKDILKYELNIIPRDFENSIRNFLANSKLRDSITKDVAISESELFWFYKNENEKVKFTYILIDKNILKDGPSVTKSEIDAFYNSNKILFKEKEEKDKISAYIVNLIKNEKSEEYVNNAAFQLYNKLKADGRSLEEFAKRNKLKLYKSELISRYDTMETTAEAAYQIVENAFKLKPGEISSPIKIKNGFIIIEPAEFKLVTEEEFNEVKEDYKNKALAMKKMMVFDDWLKNMPIDYPLDINPDKI